MDEFTYRHEDFLFVSSMGNSGTAPGDGSIGRRPPRRTCKRGSTTNGGDASQANDLMRTAGARWTTAGGSRRLFPSYYINSADGAAACSTKNTFGGRPWRRRRRRGAGARAPVFRGRVVSDGDEDGGRCADAVGGADEGVPGERRGGVTGTDWLVGGAISRSRAWTRGGVGRTWRTRCISTGRAAAAVWDVWNANGLTTGQQAEYSVNVTSGSHQLKVHLVWTDRSRARWRRRTW